MVYEARYLTWNCELKTRLSDIVSHLRNDCRQIVTQQLQKSFSTMSTACKFTEMPIFIYLSLRLLRSLFQKFENKCKSKHEGTCTTDLDLAYLLTQSQFWQLTFKWLSGARAQDKTKQYYCCFPFFLILFSYAIQGKFITWLENSALNCTWKPISHSSLRDSCDIGFRVQFNAEFPRQVMNFPIILNASFQ